MIFLIEMAWGDPMENHPSSAFGYMVAGYFEDEAKAIKFCFDSGTVTKKQYGWAAHEGAPVCRIKQVPKLDQK